MKMIDVEDIAPRAQVLGDECWRLRNAAMADKLEYKDLARVLAAAQLLCEQIVERAARISQQPEERR